MAIPSIYINLEDDVSKILTRLKRSTARQVILVCPKRCFLFSDEKNLVYLKDQTNSLGKEVFILTMDERGQAYAQAASFQLKFLPNTAGKKAISDIKRSQKHPVPLADQRVVAQSPLSNAVKEIKNIAQKFVPAALVAKQEQQSEQDNQTQPAVKPKASPVAKVEVTEAFFHPPLQEPPQEEQSPKSSTSKIITGVVALSLIVLLLLVFVILPKATVLVYAKTEPVTRDIQISMTTTATSIDTTKLVIPATQIDEAVTVNDSFQSQGKQEVGNQATGTVKIYNFTRLPITLKASTTILSVAGKDYNLVNNVILLKPTTYLNAKTKEVDPNSLGDSVQIIAAQGGDDYNMPAGTTMEISNQIFGSRPQVLYAETDSEISGGTTRYLSLITQDDVTAAQTQLQAEALAQIQDKLKSSNLVLPDMAYNFQVVQFTTDNPVGAQTPDFHATLQAKVDGLAYNQTDLNNLITQRITQTLATNKTLEPGNASSTTMQVQSYDPVNQLAVLEVHYQGQAVYSVDLSDISPELVGKSQTQANEILQSKAEIDRVDITLSPIWQKNFPWFARKINLSLATHSATSQ